ncbi:general transcription factor 3C polypeptide 6 [Zerene cesonia]|uniref:general transcription factor 3C polypeptide 6 n=1 Tax=Zerene cesonia TaxID=33412 RepID=UPI0018E5A053|nr:general transcription factor 3C polypeptide 6 [Zerene cesonia]
MNEHENLSETEEEIYVYVEFDESVSIEKYGNLHVLGIDTKNPIIQLDETFCSGNFENPLGTYMFFEDDPSAHTDDPLFDKLPDKNLKYLLKTRKFIKAEHVYVKQKDGIEKEYQERNVEPDIKPITFTSITEAIEKFKKEWINSGTSTSETK